MPCGKYEPESCRPEKKAGLSQCCAQTLSSDGLQADVLKDRRISYRANVSNSMSRNLFSALGAGSVEQAYELQRKPGAELMRMKYCIRYQYGHCPKYHKDSWPRRLFLENNGRLFPLEFDCKSCEMSVLAPDSSISKVMETSPKRS